MNQTLTGIAGIRVGHAATADGRSGCTVLLGPFRAAAHLFGMATGTREIPALSPEHLAGEAHAVLLTGGSALGLAAADGVSVWLREQGIGFPTPGGPVPIVPAAVIYDLSEGGEIPGASEGRAACEAASSQPVSEGRVGAGIGARIGALLGRQRADPGGIGCWAAEVAGHRVAALAVVNAFGDLIGGEGAVLAGARDDSGRHVGSSRRIAERGPGAWPEGAFGVGTNTTLGVVATDAPLTSVDLQRLARMAGAALSRRIIPAMTLLDGDVVFALASGEAGRCDPRLLVSLGSVAADVLAAALERSVGGGR